MYYFRADGSAVTGAGHLMRCLTVAQELQKRNRASGRTLLFVRGAGICGTVAELEHAGEDPWDGSC